VSGIALLSHSSSCASKRGPSEVLADETTFKRSRTVLNEEKPFQNYFKYFKYLSDADRERLTSTLSRFGLERLKELEKPAKKSSTLSEVILIKLRLSKLS